MYIYIHTYIHIYIYIYTHTRTLGCLDGLALRVLAGAQLLQLLL